ncbi:hypothetical protein [Actinoallomurus sp. NPDC052274]|uniref:hypothetical protein n=1 Tax=Actinoallomurus sp. NPDC052274 TaxID=3155420 RepID=UPI00341A0C4A
MRSTPVKPDPVSGGRCRSVYGEALTAPAQGPEQQRVTEEGLAQFYARWARAGESRQLAATCAERLHK